MLNVHNVDKYTVSPVPVNNILRGISVIFEKWCKLCTFTANKRLNCRSNRGIDLYSGPTETMSTWDRDRERDSDWGNRGSTRYYVPGDDRRPDASDWRDNDITNRDSYSTNSPYNSNKRSLHKDFVNSPGRSSSGASSHYPDRGGDEPGSSASARHNRSWANYYRDQADDFADNVEASNNSYYAAGSSSSSGRRADRGDGDWLQNDLPSSPSRRRRQAQESRRNNYDDDYDGFVDRLDKGAIKSSRRGHNVEDYPTSNDIGIYNPNKDPFYKYHQYRDARGDWRTPAPCETTTSSTDKELVTPKVVDNVSKAAPAVATSKTKNTGKNRYDDLLQDIDSLINSESSSTKKTKPQQQQEQSAQTIVVRNRVAEYDRSRRVQSSNDQDYGDEEDFGREDKESKSSSHESKYNSDDDDNKYEEDFEADQKSRRYYDDDDDDYDWDAKEERNRKFAYDEDDDDESNVKQAQDDDGGAKTGQTKKRYKYKYSQPLRQSTSRPVPAAVSTPTSRRVDLLRAKRALQDNATPLYYDVKYTATEIQPRTRVCMSEEIQSRKRLKELIGSKVGVLTAHTQRTEGEHGREKFYGPQLQIPWTQESNSALLKKQQQRQRTSNNSPTREVEQLLANRQNPPQQSNSKQTTTESETANNFLRSSIASNLVLNHANKHPKFHTHSHTTTPIYHKHTHIKAKQTATEQNRDYIGPQLPIDWTADTHTQYTNTQHIKTAIHIDLDKDRGRDTKRVHRKHMTEILDFTDINTLIDPNKPEPHTQGEVHPDDMFAYLHAHGRQGLVEFGRQVGRADMIGPNGEKAERDTHTLAELLPDEYKHLHDAALFDRGEYDIDAGAARDTAKRTHLVSASNFHVFAKEKEPSKDTDTQPDHYNDHIGGLWFEGMAQEVTSKPSIVHMGKQTGRISHAEEAMKRKVDEEDELLHVQEQQLDLNAAHSHAHTSTAAHTPQAHIEFADPNKYPRFRDTHTESENKEAYTHAVYEPNKNATSGAKKVVYLTNMDKQSSRWSEQAHTQSDDIVQNEIAEGATDDPTMTAAIQRERDTKQVSAQEMFVGKHARSLSVVDMGKQRGREDPKHTDADNEHDEGDEQAHTKDYMYGQGIGVERVRGGVTAWTREPTKNEGTDANTHTVADKDDAHLFESEELQLAPTHTGLSSYKPVISGPSWETHAHVDRFPLPTHTPGHDLAYEHTDHGGILSNAGGGASMGPIGTNNTGGLEFGKQSDRRTQAHKQQEEQTVITKELDHYQDEELDLKPNPYAGKKGIESSGPAWDTHKYERIVAHVPPTAGQHLDLPDPTRTDPGTELLEHTYVYDCGCMDVKSCFYECACVGIIFFICNCGFNIHCVCSGISRTGGKGPLGTNYLASDQSKQPARIDQTQALGDQFVTEEIGQPHVLILDPKHNTDMAHNVNGAGTVSWAKPQVDIRSSVRVDKPADNAAEKAANKPLEKQANKQATKQTSKQTRTQEADDEKEPPSQQTQTQTQAQSQQQLAVEETEEQQAARIKREEQKQRLQATRLALEQQKKDEADKRRDAYMKQQADAVAAIQAQREEQERLQREEQARIDSILDKIGTDGTTTTTPAGTRINTNTGTMKKGVTFAIPPKTTPEADTKATKGSKDTKSRMTGSTASGNSVSTSNRKSSSSGAKVTAAADTLVAGSSRNPVAKQVSVSTSKTPTVRDSNDMNIQSAIDSLVNSKTTSGSSNKANGGASRGVSKANAGAVPPSYSGKPKGLGDSFDHLATAEDLLKAFDQKFKIN
jgi:hypothetical protein